MTLTQEPRRHDGLCFGRSVTASSVTAGKGTLDASTCLACGFVEWYVQDPSEIPIGPEYMSELVDDSPHAAYR